MSTKKWNFANLQFANDKIRNSVNSSFLNETKNVFTNLSDSKTQKRPSKFRAQHCETSPFRVFN